MAGADGIDWRDRMTPDRNKAARELLAFYQEAGVDVPIGETPIDRLADAPAAVAPTAPPPATAVARPKGRLDRGWWARARLDLPCRASASCDPRAEPAMHLPPPPMPP